MTTPPPAHRSIARLAWLLLAGALASTGCQSTSTSTAPARGQFTADSPASLASSLASAVQAEDLDTLRSLFGPRASELRSDDPQQNEHDLSAFAGQLSDSWTLAPITSADGFQETELLVGHEAWPFAVPLLSDGTRWWFDTDTGIDELTSRRVGRNELKTIDALLTLIDAQRAYFSQDRDGDGVNEYATRLMSTPGTHDGLYWPAPGGVDPSPIGPAMAMAVSRTDGSGQRLPFWGYRYTLLTPTQTNGWAVVAYPADYDQTGVMSFMASDQGAVYERDLGPDSASAAGRMATFDPAGWVRVAGTP